MFFFQTFFAVNDKTPVFGNKIPAIERNASFGSFVDLINTSIDTYTQHKKTYVSTENQMGHVLDHSLVLNTHS